MKQLLEFIQNHWMLCSLFGASLLLLILEELKNKIGGIPRITAQAATLMLNRENAVIIDLRNKKTFADGHIINSINIERADFDNHAKKIKPHKGKELILIDDNESSAASINTKLQELGFDKIHILAGGLQAWKSANLPLKKD